MEATLARITELQRALDPRPPAAPPTVQPPQPTAFTGQLQSAMAGTYAPSPLLGAQAGGTGATGALAAARGEVGVAEQPPGSNDSPRIAEYRRATAGAPGPGPWCAYFVSWAAKQAGTPIGDWGQGFGRVDDVYAWAERSGRAHTGTPQPGELIVWDEHIGIVESVDADGTIHTVEGNSSDAVSRRTYGPDGGGAIGYVRLG